MLPPYGVNRSRGGEGTFRFMLAVGAPERLDYDCGKAVCKARWRSGRARQHEYGFPKLWKSWVRQLPDPISDRTSRQSADSKARRNGCPNASDAFASADHLVVQACLLQQIEAGFRHQHVRSKSATGSGRRCSISWKADPAQIAASR